MIRLGLIEKFKLLSALLLKYWCLIFFIVSILYLEIVYTVWTFKDVKPDFIFPLLFALSAGSIMFLITGLFPKPVHRVIAVIITVFLTFSYGMQLVYYSVFQTPFTVFSLTGAGDVLQFGDIIISAVMKNISVLILLLIPLIFLIVIGRKFPVNRLKPIPLCIILAFSVVSYVFTIICVNLTGDSAASQYTLYYKSDSPELSVRKLGLLTTIRLDLKRCVFGFNPVDDGVLTVDNNDDAIPCLSDKTPSVTNPGYTGRPGVATPTPELYTVEPSPSDTYNIMDIDFKSLIEKEKNKDLLAMHKYFSTVRPTRKNEYSGTFEGNNLILITAEGFSPYAVSAHLTPTLYKMSKEGFVFNNFYNPIWGVSTSDGEYVACTGLIPKSGVWSFSRSAKNLLPFVMGNQFGKLDYITRAYHNHSYKYYDRDKSHPNMGYEYKGVGNGLNIKKTWPESDLEMIEVTAGEYIGSKPFHTYYMTVSGHLNYTFKGNFIARKNKPHVESLPYSEQSKAYIACNMELEFAMKALLEKLEEAGVADKTVIAISPDHYPYGLERKYMDELAGHKVESNFELYKSIFILWKKGMSPVTIDKPCSSLDINPTLSNLFGLEYDSRLLMGTDILSDAPSMVIFSNRSWITDRAMYNSLTNTVTFTDGTKGDSTYTKAINRTVADKFKFSAKVLETDYYRKLNVWN